MRLLPNPRFHKECHPKLLLSSNQTYFQNLFRLLDSDNSLLTEAVWNML